MGLVRVTAHLAAPVVLGDDGLPFDDLLVAAHPTTRAAPIGRETSLAGRRWPAVPVAHLDAREARVALATVACPAPTARRVQEHTVKRRDGEDLAQLARGVNLGLGPGKNRLHRLPALVTPTLTWWAVGSPREMLKLARRILFIGRWRAAGYGVVTGWTACYDDQEPSRVLVADGVAQRTLPRSWVTWAESTGDAALLPPYWHPERAVAGVVLSGTPCALQPAIEDAVRALADPAAHRAHRNRHDIKRAAHRLDTARSVGGADA